MPGLGRRIGIGRRAASRGWTTRFPSDLTITIDTDSDITLNWVNNGTADYDDIRIYRSTDGVVFTEIDDVALGTDTYADGGLTPQSYFYKVRYKKGAGYSAYSNTATITETDFYVGIGSIVTESDEAFITEDNIYLIIE